MKKKNKILSIVMFLVLGVLILYIKPFVITSNNLITDNVQECIYREAKLIKYKKPEEVITIKNSEGERVDKLINIIDNLKVKRISAPKGSPIYLLDFTGTYKDKEGRSITETIEWIECYKENIIGFYKNYNSTPVFYKIQDKDFNMKKCIEEISLTDIK